MAIINEAIELGISEDVRDAVASILLDEWAAQYALTDNPDLNVEKIWRDRRRSFDMAELPAVNLSLASIRYSGKTAPTRDQEVRLWVDFYTLRLHEADADADEASLAAAWAMARVTQYILDYPGYRDLGLKPNVKHVETVQVTQAEADTADGGKVAVLRLEYSATVVGVSSGLTAVPLSVSGTTVKLSNSEKGYYYELTN